MCFWRFLGRDIKKDIGYAMTSIFKDNFATLESQSHMKSK